MVNITAPRTSPYLDAELSLLRGALEEQRRFRLDQLDQLAAVRGQVRRDSAGGHIEDLDASADLARIEVSAAVEAAARHALADIEAALRRIDDGCYGICTRCEDEIPLERLQAIPYAGLCMRCQRRTEHRG